LQQQLQAIEQGLVEMQSLNFGLDELKGKTGKEILAPIGRGIFARAKLISEDLLVDVGGKKFVTKNIVQTKKLRLQVTKTFFVCITFWELVIESCLLFVDSRCFFVGLFLGDCC
jgi:hypothetical protein